MRNALYLGVVFNSKHSLVLSGTETYSEDGPVMSFTCRGSCRIVPASELLRPRGAMTETDVYEIRLSTIRCWAGLGPVLVQRSFPYRPSSYSRSAPRTHFIWDGLIRNLLRTQTTRKMSSPAFYPVPHRVRCLEPWGAGRLLKQ